MTGTAGDAGPEGGAAGVLLAMLDEAHDLPPWLVPLWTVRHARRLGFFDARIHLPDYEQRMLVPLSAEAVGAEVLGTLAVEGTVAGRAYRHSELVEAVDGDDVVLHVPMLDGADRVGVLVLRCAHVDDDVRLRANRLAAVVTVLVLTEGSHTDVYFRARRLRPMTLAAEMQWELLPPLTLVEPRIEIAGILEPAYDVGGDAFDYAVNHDTAHVAIFDAMGHGLNASVMATVAVNAYRHARRSGVPVGDMYTLIDAAFTSQFTEDRFVTAQLADLHLPSGELQLVNAGHPAPLLLRDRRVVRTLGGATTLPVGLDGPAPDVITEFLEPGDGVLMYTDGVVDSRGAGEALGEARLLDIVETEMQARVPSAEFVRRVNHRILDWQKGTTGRQDDSTLLFVDWRSGELPAY